MRDLCPLKFGKGTKERAKIECDGKDCAWYVDNKCAIAQLTEELEFLRNAVQV